MENKLLRNQKVAKRDSNPIAYERKSRLLRKLAVPVLVGAVALGSLIGEAIHNNTTSTNTAYHNIYGYQTVVDHNRLRNDRSFFLEYNGKVVKVLTKADGKEYLQIRNYIDSGFMK